MENESVKNEAIDATTAEQPDQAAPDAVTADTASDVHVSELETLKAELDLLRVEHQATHDKHIRLFAEFDNFRKRTAKERIDMLQFAGENALKNMLPVLDDMERAIQNNETSGDIATVKQGFALIHAKLVHILGSQGVKPMSDLKGQLLDVDRHEAITSAPAPSLELKGKVIDVLENGYTLHDKVIRYAKVIIGE